MGVRSVVLSILQFVSRSPRRAASAWPTPGSSRSAIIMQAGTRSPGYGRQVMAAGAMRLLRGRHGQPSFIGAWL
ncbi:hypothetical protein BD413DRAFT_127300 [Trametes elegans]|nr:hypothetical protein BD413DRAFT_127300 [Trametes elegans]